MTSLRRMIRDKLAVTRNPRFIACEPGMNGIVKLSWRETNGDEAWVIACEPLAWGCAAIALRTDLNAEERRAMAQAYTDEFEGQQ